MNQAADRLPVGPPVPTPAPGPVVPSQAALPAGIPNTSAPSLSTIRVSIAEAVRLATEHFEHQRRPQAESVALEILAADPEQPDALHICGALAHLAGKNGLALALLEKAVRLQPANGQVHYNLGVVLQAVKREVEAAERYRAALALIPAHPGALQNLGNLAFFREEFAEAERCYRQALSAQPNAWMAQLSMGMLFAAQRRLAQAAPYYQRALDLAPQSPQVRWESAQFLLLGGDFRQGWALYEARFPAGDQCKVWHYPFAFPLWQGEALAGKHLLVHGEQGLGDEIMFLSLVPELLAQGARISIVGQPHLHDLWVHVFPDCTCYQQLRANDDAWTKVAPPWLHQLSGANTPDYQIPFGSLPRLLRADAAQFAAQKPYITAGPGRIAQWLRYLDERLGARRPNRLRIGLVWAGNPSRGNMIATRKDARRSIGLQPLTRLADLPGIDWVSLQTWEAAQQVRDIATRMTILDCSERLTSFGETAALVANLDLVISVDTSVCHLACAMGKPVFILLPHAGEWRWGLDPERSLWWPTARLLRQPALGDWGWVVERLRAILLAWPRPVA